METFVHLYQLTAEEAEAEAQRIRPQGDYRLECLGAGPDYRGTWIVDWTKYVVVSIGHLPGETYHRAVSVIETAPGYDGDALLKAMPGYNEDYIFPQVVEFSNLQDAEGHLSYLMGNA